MMTRTHFFSFKSSIEKYASQLVAHFFFSQQWREEHLDVIDLIYFKPFIFKKILFRRTLGTLWKEVDKQCTRRW